MSKFSDAQLKVKFPPLHINQQPIHDSKARFKVLACGRRFGKTALSYRAVLETALQPGGGRVWYIAPSYQISYQAWRALLRMAEPLIAEKREMEKFFVLKNGGEIAFKTAGSDEKLRGAGLNLAVLDEAAFLPDRFFPEVIMPMLADRKGSALFCSTPNGINSFYDYYGYGLDAAFPDWESWHFTSYDNPYIDPKEIDAIKLTTPDIIFRQEFLAEFLDQGGSVFSNLKEICVLSEVSACYPGHMYVAGIDWGRSNDFSVISVFDASIREQVAYRRIRDVDYESQRNMIKAVCTKYNVSQVLAEANTIGAPNIEALAAEGVPIVPFITTQSTKHLLVSEMIHNMETKSVRLLNDPLLIGEMGSYTSSKSKNGFYSYSASRGHDDILMATMLANHLLGVPAPLYSSVKKLVEIVPRAAVSHRSGFRGHAQPQGIDFGNYTGLNFGNTIKRTAR